MNCRKTLFFSSTHAVGVSDCAVKYGNPTEENHSRVTRAYPKRERGIDLPETPAERSNLRVCAPIIILASRFSTEKLIIIIKAINE